MATPVSSSQVTEWAFIASNADPSTSAFAGTTVTHEPVSDSVGMDQTILPTEAMMGSRFEYADRSRIISELVTGQLVFEASPAVLGFFLPYITGDSGGSLTLSEGAASDFDFMRDDGQTEWLFRNCFITQATISVSNGRVMLSLDVAGKVGTHPGTGFANAAIVTTNVHEGYVEGEAAITLASTTLYAESWQLNISTGIELFARQSTTPNRVRIGQPSVNFSANLEWSTANEGLVFDKGVSGIAGNITLSRLGMSTIFAWNHLVISNNPFGADGGELLWNFEGVSRRLAATDVEILTVTHDQVPS